MYVVYRPAMQQAIDIIGPLFWMGLFDIFADCSDSYWIVPGTMDE